MLFPFRRIPQIFPQNPVETAISRNREKLVKKYRVMCCFLSPKIPQIFPQNRVETNVLNTQNRSFLGKKKMKQKIFDASIVFPNFIENTKENRKIRKLFVSKRTTKQKRYSFAVT